MKFKLYLIVATSSLLFSCSNQYPQSLRSSQGSIDMSKAASSEKIEVSTSASDSSTKPLIGFKSGLVDGSAIKWDGKTYAAPDSKTYEAFLALEKLAGTSFLEGCEPTPPAGIAGTASFKTFITVVNGQIQLFKEIYLGSNNCAGSPSFAAGEVFDLTNPKTAGPAEFKVDIRYSSHAVVPLSNAAVATLNSSNFCSKNNWIINQIHYDVNESNVGCPTEDQMNNIGAVSQSMTLGADGSSFTAFGSNFSEDFQNPIF